MSLKTNNFKLFKYEDSDAADLRFLHDSMDIIDKGINPFYVATLDSANTYKVITGLNKTALNDGYSIKVAIPSNSTGAVSIKVDSVTIAVKKPNGSAVTNFKQNAVYSLTYFNGNFILASGGGTDDVNFSASDLLTGKTANDSNGEKVNGTMPNNGTVTQSLSANGSLTLPKGYYDSIKITQNIPNRGEYQMAGGIGSGDDYIALNKIPYGYYPQSSNGWAPEIRAKKTDIAKTFGITADKIVKGNNILGVAGTATIGSLGGKNYKSGTTTGFKTYDTDTGSPNHYPMATYSIKINISFTPKVLVVKDSNGKLLALATVGYSFYYFDSPWGSGNFKHGWKEAEPSSLNNKNIYIREIAKYSGSFSDTYNSGETLTWEAWA